MLQEEILNLSANKSFSDLKSLYNITKFKLRSFISDKLKCYTEDNPFKCYAALPSYDKGFFGLSELQKPHVTSLYQKSNVSGDIMVHIEGDEEDCELEEHSLEDQLFMAQLLENI